MKQELKTLLDKLEFICRGLKRALEEAKKQYDSYETRNKV